MAVGDLQIEAEVFRTRLATGWTATSIDWGFFNGGVGEWDGDEPHVRPAITTGSASRLSMGPNARRRAYGLATVSVFRPLGEGDANARSDALTLESLFRDYESQGVTFGEPSSTVVGPDPEGRPFFQINVNVPFRRDRIV